MNLKNPHAWIALAAAAVVASIAFVDSGRTSPGELSMVHLREEDLEGGGGCADCHGGWRRSMTEACLVCHAVIEEQLEAQEGLHGRLGAVAGERCAVCHSDHHGRGFELVNPQSFRLAGFGDPDSFEHSAIGFDMGGKHLELECAKCHSQADARVLPKGEPRFLGLDQGCTACHEDPHEGSMVPACAQCHGQEGFDLLHSVGHEEFLALTGGHAGVDCRKCHAETSIHSLEALGEGVRLITPRECADCHESPHDTDFVGGIALLVRASTEGSCVTCHVGEHETFDQEAIELTPFQHAASGFLLDAPHGEVTCDECHSEERVSFEARYPGRSADACGACHDDPHGGQFHEGPFAGLECTACHERLAFEPPAFGLREHERTAMPLTGTHLDTDCAECHEVPFEGRPRQFRGTPSRCGRCHEDAHRGFFTEPARKNDPDGEGCAACHLTTTFDELAAGGFDHELWTGFPVEGSHAAAACEVCHPLGEEPDERGRRFGLVAEHFGEVDGCVTCHVDPHGGAFGGDHLPRWVHGEDGCARCHVDVSFRTFPNGFDHGRWTGFPIEGAHARAGCSTCHSPLAAPDELGRTWAEAPGSACADCHVDPHARQFEVKGETDCGRCHAAAGRTFRELVFNHTWDSRFPLGEAHEKVPCSQCHPTVPFGDAETVRYRPLKRDCIDCHGDHREAVRRKDTKKP